MKFYIRNFQTDFSDWWLGISREIALIWMSLDFTDDQSKLVQVMAWCRQATSHYLSQCWPRCLSPYGITRPQWVNLIFSKLSHRHNTCTKNVIYFSEWGSSFKYFTAALATNIILFVIYCFTIKIKNTEVFLWFWISLPVFVTFYILNTEIQLSGRQYKQRSFNKTAPCRKRHFQNAFSWKRILVIWFKFHWSLFLRIQLTIRHHCISILRLGCCPCPI